jgi:Asp-tRNA(Asn)/Glu-tRNA(Gln) amidotransferase A subunit family amidase
MTDTPWLGDACSLVDAFRNREHSPAEELEASLRAINGSALNAFCFVDEEGALERARNADVQMPFGGVPIGVKELERFAGWPARDGSLVMKDEIATYTTTIVSRLMELGGSNPIGLTTASEFGGLGISTTRLNGTTRNPWDPSKSTGGSSAGSSAAVAGGLVTIASGGDGGGSIRIPASFCGLLGMKGTRGRIPHGPFAEVGPLTVVVGCMARSVRDVARWYDVCGGADTHDPFSLPKVERWERDLGSQVEALAGKRVAIAPDLGSAIVRPEVKEIVQLQGEILAKRAGLEIVEIDIRLPDLGVEWLMANVAVVLAHLGDRWPDCRDDLTLELPMLIDLVSGAVSIEALARAEASRIAAHESMADLFDQVDFVISASTPDVACGAEVTLNTLVGDQQVEVLNSGALTIPANVYGNPAVSIPAGDLDGLPVGFQVMAKHHCDALLLDLSLVAEREMPWPLIAPGVDV